jgi:hypothetical protein
MKQVIVLVDNELLQSKLLHDVDFGTIDTNRWMCAVHKPNIKKVFMFQTFGLIVDDIKMDNFMSTKDGIVMVVNPSTVNKSIVNRVVTIVQNNTHIPIMIYLEDNVKKQEPIINKPWSLSSEEIKNKQQMDLQNNITTQFKNIIEQLSKKYSNFKYFYDTSLANNWFNSAVDRDNPNKKEVKLTSTNIDSNMMAEQFQNETLPLHIWDHYGRLRIVHYSLMKYGYKNTIDQSGWLCTNWKAYKTSIGHGDLWHYSLTRFWVNVIYNLQIKNNYKSFDELYNNNPSIQNGSLFKKYYSDNVIFTPKARMEWVEPDLKV